jgi:hypothetical protein
MIPSPELSLPFEENDIQSTHGNELLVNEERDEVMIRTSRRRVPLALH